MKKKTNLFILLIYFFLCTSILPELYVYFLYEKNESYWCNYYSEKDSTTLYDLFKNEDDYLKIYMLSNIEKCDKVKSTNTAPIMYYKYNFKTGSNPFALLPLPYVYTKYSLEDVNMELSKILKEPVYKKEKDNLMQIEDDFYLYWSNKIYQKTGIIISKKISTTSNYWKALLFFSITFPLLMFFHFKLYKKNNRI